MDHLKNEVDRLKKLMAKIRVYEMVSKNLREGKNGYFTRGMESFKMRLRRAIGKERY